MKIKLTGFGAKSVEARVAQAVKTNEGWELVDFKSDGGENTVVLSKCPPNGIGEGDYCTHWLCHADMDQNYGSAFLISGHYDMTEDDGRQSLSNRFALVGGGRKDYDALLVEKMRLATQ